jgi:hypothetical protein
MSQATVYATAQFGCASDSTASGLFAGTVTWNHTSEQALAPNHIGCDVGFSVYNAKKDVTIDGIVAVKATGLVGNIGSVIVLANSTASTRSRNSENLGVSAVASAGLIIVGGNISTTATGFETGSTNAVFIPGVVTTSPTVLT